MGETRVDLLHLLEDLRDAYPASLEATVVTELVANALDSGARVVRLDTDAAASTLTVADDGKGMTRPQLRRFHDLGASTKRRGAGIGFAGVGVKLGLLLGDAVEAETRRGRTHVATRWHLSSRQRAPWRWVEPPGLVAGERGTAVRLTLSNALSPLLDASYLEALLRGHFQSLLDPGVAPMLAAAYPEGVRFVVDGRALAPERAGDVARRAPIAVKLARKRKPSALGWLERYEEPLPEDRRGVAIATLGKVIRRGWDWLGLSPQGGERITGLIEAPGLAEALTLNKADFIRSGTRGAIYLGYRKAIQEAVGAQLEAWGDAPPSAPPRRPRVRPIERDLRDVLLDLADDYPLLNALVERRAGGQRRIPFASRTGADGGWAAAAALVAAAEAREPEPPYGEAEGAEGGAGAQPGGTSEGGAGEAATSPGERVQSAAGEPAGRASLPGSGVKRRPGRYGLDIRFESRPDDASLGRLVESTVWVNDAHPAYRRAAKTRAEPYHLALTVALALAPLAVEPAGAHAFVTDFLARWGEAAE